MAGDSPAIAEGAVRPRVAPQPQAWECREREVGLSLAGLLGVFNKMVTDSNPCEKGS